MLLMVGSALLVPLVHSASVVTVSGGYSNEMLDPSRPRLYLTDPTTNSVVVINTTSDAQVASIFVGSQPAGMDISADDRELYVALSGANSLAVVNLDTLKLNRTIDLHAPPADVAAGRLGRAYVTLQGQWEHPYPLIVDTNSSRVVGNITSGGQIYGGALARVSPDHNSLYIGERGLSPASLYRFSVSTDNITLVWEAPSGSVGENLKDLAISPDGSRLYVASGAPYYIQVIDSTNWSPLGQLQTGAYPASVALAFHGGVAFAAHWPYPSEVSLYNTTTFLEMTSFSTLEPNGAPFMVRSDPTGARIYVLDSASWGGQLGQLEIFGTRTPYWPAGSSLNATAYGPTGATLSWNEATVWNPGGAGATVVAYRINETIQGQPPVSALGTVGGSIRTFQVTGLSPGTLYFFAVQAKDSLGDWSVSGLTVEFQTPPLVTNTTTTSSSTSTSPSTTTTGTTASTTFSMFGNSSSSSQLLPGNTGLGNGYNMLGIGVVATGIAVALSVRSRSVGTKHGGGAMGAVSATDGLVGRKITQELNGADVISRTFESYGRGFPSYLAVFLVVEAVVGTLTTVVRNSVVLPPIPSNATPTQLLAWLPGFLGALLWLLFLIVMISWIFGAIATGMTIKLTSQQIENGKTNFGESLRDTVKRLPALWMVSLIVGIAAFFASLALIVPGIIVTIMFSLSLPAVMIENAGILGSLGRSRQLVSHRWLKSFGIFFLMGIIIIGAAIVVNMAGAQFGFWSTIAAGLMSALYLPLVPIALTVYYYSNAARIAPPQAPPVVTPVALTVPATPPAAPIGGYCPNCGAQVMEADQNFCRKCGRDLRPKRA